MRWDGRVRKRSGTSGRRNSRLPSSSRIFLGSVAIILMALAFVLRPGQPAQDTGTTAPEAKPTYAAAAAVAAGIAPVAPAASATPAPTASSASSASSQERVYTVQSGDTLSSIAKHFYGDASKWQKILDANKDVLKSANSLQLGQKLKIPQ